MPSSWSAEIDRFTCGVDEDISRLFVISAGNNRDVRHDSDYWDQVALSPIEDPAQSWNALTVGAYTELSTIDDPAFDGWTAFAMPGDVSPSSRSSVNWSWRNRLLINLMSLPRVEIMLFLPTGLRLITALMYLCLPHRVKRQVLLLKVMGTQVLHVR